MTLISAPAKTAAERINRTWVAKSESVQAAEIIQGHIERIIQDAIDLAKHNLAENLRERLADDDPLND